MKLPFHFRCVSVTEELSGNETTWAVRLEPTPFPEEAVNGKVKYGGRGGGELVLRIFDPRLASGFHVGGYYAADLEQVEPPS